MLRSRTRRTALAGLALTIALAILLAPAPPLNAADHGDAPYNSRTYAVEIEHC